MKSNQKVLAVQQKAIKLGQNWASGLVPYPVEIVDLIIFHKLHLTRPVDQALRSFHRLKDNFVDWNEVRVSTVREIQQEVVGTGENLSVAVFIKDFLEFVHRERQKVSLEFLVEENLGDIRRYLKQIKGIDRSTVELILRVRKEYPALPLSPAAEAVMDRLGLFRTMERRGQKEKALHEVLEPEKALLFHHFLLTLSQEHCPPDEESVDCPRCSMRSLCAFYARSHSSGRRKVPAKNSRSTTRTRSKTAEKGPSRRSGGENRARSSARSGGSRKSLAGRGSRGLSSRS